MEKKLPVGVTIGPIVVFSGQSTLVSLYSVLDTFNTSFKQVFFVKRKHEPLRSKVDGADQLVQLSVQSKKIGGK